MKAPIQLYRHFDAKGKLLYVGISRNSGMRFAGHRRNSAWAHLSTRMTVEMFPSRLAASIAELKAIENEKPLHNKAHLERPVLVNVLSKPLDRPRRTEATVMFSARVLVSVAEQANKHCKRTGLSRSDLIDRALKKFLKMT